MMFEELERINSRPEPFEFYTAADLWTDEHTSQEMLRYHLNESVDLSSRNTDFIDRSVDWIVSHFKVKPGTKIADFGCGPGLYAARLAQQGVDVTGIDFSQRSIQYATESAAEEGLSITYVNQNYLEFETDAHFDLIIMIMCDFSVLSPKQRETLLTKFHRFLKPGGSVLLDVHSLAMFEQRQEAAAYGLNSLDSFWSPNKYYAFQNTFKYEQEKVILDKYTIVEADRIRTVYNWFQCFSPEALQREFARCGLQAEAFFGDVAGGAFDSDAGEFAIAATRQQTQEAE